MKIVKRIVKWIGYLFGALVLLVMAQLAYGYYKEPIAKQLAIDFCAAVKIGDLADGLELKAQENGASIAKWSTSGDGQRVLMATYIGMPPFSRHICVIKADSKSVLEAKYTYLD